MSKSEAESSQLTASAMIGQDAKGHPPAVIAGFSGWLLDAFDFFLVTFCLTAIAHDFHKSDAQIALLITFLPAFLLSGFLFAIEQMPPALQWITRILPARYYVSALKKIFLKGTSTAMLTADLIPLAVFAIILTFVATRSFHKRLE